MDQNLENSQVEEQPFINENAMSPSKVKKFIKCFKLYVTIEPLVFVMCLTDTISGILTTNLIISQTCKIHFQFNKSICDSLGFANKNNSETEALIQPYASAIVTGMSIFSILIPALMSFFLGSWSDQNGRKLLLIIPSIGYCLKYLLLLGFSNISSFHPLYGLVVILPVAFSGGMVNFIFASYSYISDITTDKNRYFRISILESIFFLAVIIGSLSTSPLFNVIKSNGYQMSYGFCSGLLFLATTISYFFLKESININENKKGILHIFELKLLKDMFKVCFKKRENYERAIILTVILSLTLTISAMEGESNIKFLFTRRKFDWSIQDYTFWLSVTLSVNFIGLLTGSFILGKWLKISDAILAIISYVMHAAGDLYVALLPHNYPKMMYFAGLVKFFSGLCGPAGRAVLSKSVPKEDLGKVFALTATCEAFFPLIISSFYTLLYNFTINVFPSAFFLLSASFYILNVVIFTFVKVVQTPLSELQYNGLINGIDTQ